MQNEAIGFDLTKKDLKPNPKSVDGWLWTGNTLSRWIPYDVKERTDRIFILKDECDQLIKTHGPIVLYAIYRNRSSASSTPQPPDILTSVNAVMQTWVQEVNMEGKNQFKYTNCVSSSPVSYHLHGNNTYIDPCVASKSPLTFEQVIEILP